MSTIQQLTLRIVRAIAKGERKPSEIARAIGRNSAQEISQQMERLRDPGFILREAPVTEMRQTRSRNSLYWIADAYINFWHRFVDPSQSLVARGLGERIWDRSIAPALQQYISRPTFERASRQFLWRALSAGMLAKDLKFADVGTWWGSGDREIDDVALDGGGLVTLVGSCKWTNASRNVSEYAGLLADIAAAAKNLGIDPATIGVPSGPYLALFSRCGFTDRLGELATAQTPDRMLLISLDDTYAV